MHIHEGVLHPAVLATGWIIAAGGLAVGLRRLPGTQVMHAALLAAGFFVASFIHFSVGAVYIHLTLNALVGLLLGWAAFPVIFTGLLLQALLFNYGGLFVLGVNTVVMALPAVACGLLLQRSLALASRPKTFPIVFAVCATLLFSNILYVLALVASGKELHTLAKIAFTASLPLMLVEAPITLFVIRMLHRVRPGLFQMSEKP